MIDGRDFPNLRFQVMKYSIFSHWSNVNSSKIEKQTIFTISKGYVWEKMAKNILFGLFSFFRHRHKKLKKT